ncbi:MAG: response regulator transcription factor [Ignavibacteria bacterium]|nr:response regulator transcription factor [Ignavibacteria bacterium]
MKNEIKILLIEDDKNLSTLLKEFLEVKGYSVTQAFNGEEGLSAYQESEYDLCILDVMMPKMDGFTLAKKIQDHNPQTPFLFLSAKAMLDDKLKGLKLGADDYVTKPFSMEELLLRLKVILKRSALIESEIEQTKFSIGSYTFDFEKRLLKHDGFEQKLTSKEAELLNLLCLHKNSILERSIALNKIWQNDNYFTARSMDVYITKLRSYFKNDSSIEIVNVHGTGFKLQSND